ncbi:MAG: NirA family protein [Akkermansiaceae bacterium]|nr:NirA family protein [Verrucomicrobiales bacterium]
METAVEITNGFSAEQKEYLAGFMAGVAQRNPGLFVGATEDGSLTDDPSTGGQNLAASREETVYGTPLADVTKQERWKHEEHPLDGWDRILAHAEADKLPDEENTYRLRNFGLFFVGPVQNSLMLRCRIPAGELTSVQLTGLADIAEEFGNGKAALTTRSNLQIREIAPRNMVNVLTRLQSLGLTARGSGVDNIRNVTASPTAGFDPQELIDTRPFAHALHHYILNHRDLYGLPRKFNVAFEGGGSVDTVADSNDIGFMAVTIPSSSAGSAVEPGMQRRDDEQELAGISIKDGAAISIKPGVYFRVELCGITGHKQLASDCGVLIKPSEAVAVSAAMIRVFVEHGDRTDRKKARLKYLIDQWGVEKFLQETQKKLAFPLLKFPLTQCILRPPALRHGHIGVYRQKQKGRNYIGAVIPVGIMSVRQMRRMAEIATNYGSGQVRLTPWQNLLIPDVADGFVETVKRQLVRMGFHHESTNIAGGLIACTGNQGCKWAATDTKGHALALGEHLNKRVQLDQPVNIHLTGCPHSCAQHYIGDIGLQGVKVNASGSSVEGYNIVLGGGSGLNSAIAKEVFKGISFSEVPTLLERVMSAYLARRQGGESFAAFTRRHEVKQLQEMFST